MPYKLLHNLISLPKTERGRATTLKGDPKGKTFLYCNGNSVFIRNVEDPSVADVYTQHAKDTTVACYAPSGFYIASGDKSGKLRIWDTTNEEHILKCEYQILSGAILDIQWTEDSKRILAVGEGRERYASIIMWDTGTSVGKLIYHSNAILQADIKQNRPYRLVTGSEDYKVGFFDGPPFKNCASKSDHSNFVNCVRYAPDGSYFASGGADGKIFVYDGKTADLKLQINFSVGDGRAHKGGIYGLSWHSDSVRLLSCSADKSAKVWDVKANTCLTEFKFPDVLENQQLGCLWIGEQIITVSLNGNLNYLDINNPSEPKRVIKGHNKGVMSIVAAADGSGVFSAASNGLINVWDKNTNCAENVKGKHHLNLVSSMSAKDNVIVTCSMDDTVKVINVSAGEYLPICVGMGSQPQAVSAGSNGLIVVACLAEVTVIRNGKVVFNEKVDYEPSAIALHPNETVVAVGSKKSNLIRLYELEHDVLKDAGTIEAKDATTCLQYSRDGMYLGSTDAGKALKIFDSSNMDYEEIRTWGYHYAKATALAFSPGTRYVASCGVDGAIHIFNMDNKVHHSSIKGAHSSSGIVTSVTWLDDNHLVSSCQQDCSLRIWEIVEE